MWSSWCLCTTCGLPTQAALLVAQKAGQARGATLFTVALCHICTVVFVMMAAYFAALGRTATFCHSLLSIRVVITYTDLQYLF